MRATRFFNPAGPLSLRDIGMLTGARLDRGDPGATVTGAAPPDAAGPRDLTFLDRSCAPDQPGSVVAAACLADEGHAEAVPPATALLVTADPYRAYQAVLAALFPDASGYRGSYDRHRAGPDSGHGRTDDGASREPGRIAGRVHPAAEVEGNVVVEPGAVVGSGAMIGCDSVVGAGAVVGIGVKVGRGCAIAPHASIDHALIGDRVVVRAGARIGQDGLGASADRRGRGGAPQIGRVILQDEVEIGANSCIDRGEDRDTVIGEGTRIGNLAQIGGGVSVGRYCLIGDQVRLAHLAVVGDRVVVALPPAVDFEPESGSTQIAVGGDLGEKKQA